MRPTAGRSIRRSARLAFVTSSHGASSSGSRPIQVPKQLEHPRDQLSVKTVEQWARSNWKSQPSRRAALRSLKRRLGSPRRAASCVPDCSVDVAWRDRATARRLPRLITCSRNDHRLLLPRSDQVRLDHRLPAAGSLFGRTLERRVEEQANRLPEMEGEGQYARPGDLPSARGDEDCQEADGQKKGKLFLTVKGTPFTKDIVRQRFRHLAKKLGFVYCLYHFRHGFAHRNLAGEDDAPRRPDLHGPSIHGTPAKPTPT